MAYRTPFGPEPTAQSFELKKEGAQPVVGHTEFRDGPRFFRHFRGALAEKDLAGKEILDIGCGYGGRTVYYADVCGARFVHGVEIDGRMVERCTDLAAELGSRRVAFSLGFAEDLPFPDCSFDAVISFDVLEHCRDPKKAVHEMSRVLRIGGTAWNVFPTYRGMRSSHLGYLTNLPALHRIFHPDTIIRVVNEFLEWDGARLGTPLQPEPAWSSLGWYTLPSMNGLTLKQARRIFTSTDRLRCDRIIVTPLIDPQLSYGEMKAALGSSRVLGVLSWIVANMLGSLQHAVSVPEFLVQNIAVSSTKIA